MRETTVMIVEDHPLFSKGLSVLITSQPMYSVIGEVRGAADALELLRKKKPSLAIVDLNLEDADGLDLIKSLKAEEPDIVVLVLSMYDERYYSERAIHAGARGYVMKNQTGEKVMEAIKTVMSGKIYLSDSEQERLLESISTGKIKKDKDWFDTVQELSDRQFQVFSMIGKGLGNIEISARLNLSSKTVDTHKEHLKQKLHCNSSQELRQLAVEWNSHFAVMH